MKTLYFYISLILLGFCLSSCDSEPEVGFQFSGSDMGAVNFQAPQINEDIPRIITKSADFTMLDPSLFIVEIYKKGETTYYKRFDTFEKLKEEGMPLELPVGEYIIKAFSYDSVAMLRDKPYFRGETALTIEAHEVSSASVECKYQSLGVEIVLSNAFLNFFHDTYTITVIQDTGHSATVSKDERQAIYFTQDCTYLKVTVECTTKDNEKYPTMVYYFNKDGDDPQFTNDGPHKGEYFIITLDTDKASGKIA